MCHVRGRRTPTDDGRQPAQSRGSLRKPWRSGEFMKRLVLLFAGTLLVVAIATATSVTPRSRPVRAEEPLPWNGAAKESEGPQSFLDLSASAGKPVTQAQVKRAVAQAAALPEASDSSRWQFVGPSNVGGRVTDLAIDPTTSPSTVYASVGSGGGVKSTDGGNVWTPGGPARSHQGVGAAGPRPDGTPDAGTGEGVNPVGGGSTFM